MTLTATYGRYRIVYTRHRVSGLWNARLQYRVNLFLGLYTWRTVAATITAQCTDPDEILPALRELRQGAVWHKIVDRRIRRWEAKQKQVNKTNQYDREI